MTTVPKYSHQDVVEFLRNSTTPEDLTCPISLELIKRPARINGDTTQQSYEAEAARRALDRFRNPLTRALVTAHPALLPDAQTQRRGQQFRAMLLGYTKVAAYMEEQSLPMPRDGGLLQPQASVDLPAPTLRQVAAGQLIRNAFVAHTARQPLKQPPLSRQFHQRAIETAKRGKEAAKVAQHASARAKQVAENAEKMAESTLAVTRSPLWIFDTHGDDVAQEAEELGINANTFKKTFGAAVLAQAVETMSAQTPKNWQSLTDATEAAGHTLSDVLMSQDGAFLRAVLQDRAYEGLATQVGVLKPRSQDGLSIDAANASSGTYIGESTDGKRHGLGLLVKPDGTFSGGEWQNDKLHGLARHTHAAGSAQGYWENGVFRFGVMAQKNARPLEASGYFSKRGIEGWAVIRTDKEETSGLFQASALVKGSRHFAIGDVELLAPSDAPDEGSVGCITGLSQFSKMYYGALENGRANGFGLLLDPWGEGSAGHWKQGQLHGPGSQLRSTSLRYGIWSTSGFKMESEVEPDGADLFSFIDSSDDEGDTF